MNVLGLMASPFKEGNSAILLEKAFEGCRTKKADIERIDLVDEPLPPCIGCFQCRGGEKLCVPTPEINGLLKKIRNANALIFSTPVWWLSCSSYLKLLLDHFVVYFREDYSSTIAGKKVVVMAVSGGGEETGTRETILVLKKSLTFLDLKWVGDLRVTNKAAHGAVQKDELALAKAYELGEKLCSP